MTHNPIQLRGMTFDEVMQEMQRPKQLVTSVTSDRFLTIGWETRTPVLSHELKGAFEVENGNAEWKGRKILLIETRKENHGATRHQIPIGHALMGYEIMGDLCVWVGMEDRWEDALDLQPGQTFTYRQRRRRVLSDQEILAITQSGTFKAESITRVRDRG